MAAGLDLAEELFALIRALEHDGVEYALAGALALAVHGVPRATADIDLLIRPDAVGAALAVARRRGFDIEAPAMTFADGLRLHRVTKLAGADALTLDLLLVDVGLEGPWKGRERRALESGGAVWVVSRDGLRAMKARAGRDSDLADLRRLDELDG